MNKILLIDTIHPAFDRMMKSYNYDCIHGENLSRDEILNNIKDYTGIVIRSRFKIDKSFLASARHLKFIARAGSGMENIDVETAASFGIHCIHAPEGNRTAVAEHAMAMLLSLLNNLLRSDREVRGGIWLREENRGHELEGKTVGIIGFGNTGSSMALRLKAFNCTILVYDKYKSVNQTDYPGIEFVSMDRIFNEADILSVHLPLTEETRYLINENFISKFINPFWFINTSRGKIVDTSAVVNALKYNKIRGAALDVLEYEHLSFEDIEIHSWPEPFRILTEMDNVILSPHIAGWTFESHEKISIVMAEKAIAVLTDGNEDTKKH